MKPPGAAGSPVTAPNSTLTVRIIQSGNEIQNSTRNDLVQQVVTEDRQRGRDHRDRHRDHCGVETEQRVQALQHQQQVDDVEPGEHEQRRQQHQDHPAITELRAGLDHLRQAEVRALGAVKRHEQRAEHDARVPASVVQSAVRPTLGPTKPMVMVKKVKLPRNQNGP